MKALAIIDELYRHMEWADAAIWDAVLSNERTATDAGIRERLHHIHAVQSAYFTIWTGAELEYREVSAFEDGFVSSTSGKKSGLQNGLDGAPGYVDMAWSHRVHLRVACA